MRASFLAIVFLVSLFGSGKALADDKKADPVCMANAVATRENAFIAAWEIARAAVDAALVTRRDALVAAWSLPEHRAIHDAIDLAIGTFRVTVKQIRRDFRQSVKNAEFVYKDTVKNVCKEQKQQNESQTMEDGEVL